LIVHLPIRRTIAVVLLLLTGAVAGYAQYFPPTKVNPNDGLQRDIVKTGLYIFAGKGSNSLLRLSANGLIVVDGKLPGSYDDLVARVEHVVRQPIRVLILTDISEDSAGNAATFLKNGTPVIVQQNLAPKLLALQFQGTKPPGFETFDREYTIKMGGIEARLMHFGNAYTNGDTVVYFPNLKVVSVGKLFTSSPVPDYSAGGSLVGWGPVLDEVLKLDFDTAVPANGQPITKAELQAYKDKIDSLVANAKALVQKGVPKQKILAMLNNQTPGLQINLGPEQLDHFYSEVSASQVASR